MFSALEQENLSKEQEITSLQREDSALEGQVDKLELFWTAGRRALLSFGRMRAKIGVIFFSLVGGVYFTRMRTGRRIKVQLYAYIN